MKPKRGGITIPLNIDFVYIPFTQSTLGVLIPFSNFVTTPPQIPKKITRNNDRNAIP
jgi:hypothetical protein